MITKHQSYYGIRKTRLNKFWGEEYYNHVTTHPIWYCDQCRKYITDPKFVQTHDQTTHATTPSASEPTTTSHRQD